MKIYIDAGHGGSDPGAVGNGLFEKDLILDISLRQKYLFEKLGHSVKISRTVDKYVSLNDRVDEANMWGADIFISNHINAGGGEGEEVWHSVNGGKGKEYAEKVEKNLRKIFKSRGLKSKTGENGDYLYVIRETKMPAILVEYGFIDSKVDCERLKNVRIRQKCAEAVVCGVLGQVAQNKSSKDIEASKKINSQKNTNAVKLNRLLKYNNPILKGEDIKLVQERLNKLGFDAGIEDGVYGKITEFAVRRFQRAKGLTVDGIVGQNTWKKLME